MPQPLLKLIQDNETGLWMVYYTPGNPEGSLFGQEEQAQQSGFESDEAREIVLGQLNLNYFVARYIGGDRPPLPPKNP